MKKRTLTYLGMVILGMLLGVQTFAQTNVNHSTGAQDFTVTSPAFYNYYDNGGPGANYGNGFHNSAGNRVTFSPGTPGNKVQAQFTAFNTETNWDALYVFDGPTVNDPKIASANPDPTGAPNPWGNGGWWGTTAPNNIGAGLVRATGATGALTFAFDSDASVTFPGWAAVITEIQVCTIVAPADQSLSTDATVCSATANVPAPTFTPGGCEAGGTVTYTVNGVTMSFPTPLPANFIIPGLPPGDNDITWTLLDASGGFVSSDVQTITVSDMTDPVINCPADIFVTLLPGECEAFVNFNVTATDNCPFQGPGGTVNTITTGGNGNSVGGMVWFNVNNLTGGNITISEFGMNISGSTTVNVYTKAGTHVGFETNPGAWTLAGTADATTGPWSGPFPGNGTITPAPTTGIVIPPGLHGIALHTLTASSNYTNGNGANQFFTDGSIELLLGSTANTAWGAPFTPRVFNGYVTYQTASADPEPVQTAGLPSGSAFQLGTTVNCFEITDVAGNSADCCFNVTVLENPNVTNTLTCNDLVQISLDESCQAVIGADQILEGGPYGCYDTRYTVMVLGPTGQNLGNTVYGSLPNPTNINFANGQQWNVKVTDDTTGQSCWGKIIVEDKLPPVLECRDITVACTEEPPLVPAAALVGPQAIIYEDVNEIIENGPGTSPRIYDFDFSYLPAGTPVLDADVRIKLTGHTWLPDLNMTLESPDGTVVDFFTLTGCFGAEWPIDVTFDDEGAGNLTQCVQLDVAGAPVQPVCAPGVSCQVLDAFDGLDASGTWTLNISDAVAADDGLIEIVGVIITVNLPAIDAVDNCGGVLTVANGGLTYVDNFTDGSCGGPSATRLRTWTATDASGNSATCTQTITYERPTLDDVEVPGDVVWSCDQYNAFANIIEPTALQQYLLDCDTNTAVLEFTCYDPDCNDQWLNNSATWDNPNTDNTDQFTCTVTGTGNVNAFGLENADVLALTGSGVPTVNGQPLEDLCDIGVDYEDITIDICPGTFKIVRKWTLIDWCADPIDVREFNQVIKVVDEEAPQLKMVSQDTFHQVYTIGANGPLVVNGANSTIVVSTTSSNAPNYIYQIGDTTEIVFNPNGTVQSWNVVEDVIIIQPSVKLKLRKFQFVTALTINVYNASAPSGGPHAVCKGTVNVPPAVSMGDNCSGVAGYTTELWTVSPQGLPMTQIASIPGNGGLFPNIPLYQNGIPAKYIARYYAVDGCGNQAFYDITITLRDRVPPVAVCDEITEVSIINNSVGTGGSCSTLHAEDLDDGSYDNCAPVYFLMAKMDDSFSPTIFNRCYYPTRDFCCEDIGEQTVILLVLDADPFSFPGLITTINQPALGCDGTPGLLLSATANYPFNYNTCMVTVEVTDKLPPVLQNCPANQRITCDWYADNLETDLQGLTGAEQCDVLTDYGFGQPTFYDNCEVNVTCNTNINLDQCLEGTITRTWTAVDGSGNPGTQPCNQTIFVDHVSDWVVEFPADITINCGTTTPDFGEPEIFFETCELVGVSYEDETFNVVPDACFKILRTWTVINWCVVGDQIDQEVVESSERAFQLAFPLEPCDFDGDGDCDTRTFRDSWRVNPKSKPSAIQATQTTNPDTDLDSDPWDGYITYQQTIKVSDNVDPVFTNGCQIPDVCIEDNTCGATVLLPTPDIDECSPNVTINAQITIGGVTLNGFGPYLNVAPGTYNVHYTAIDNCNNQSACNTTVTVKDCKKPTPYCKNGLVIELMVGGAMNGTVELWASDFDAGSFDNCTPQNQLKLSFSANVNNTNATYTCDDLGQQPIQLWVTDLAGNQDYCETFVIIQANMGQCTDDPLVAGAVETETDLGVEGVSININSPSGFGNNTTTDAAGLFNMNVPTGNDYTVTPVLDENPLNGVTTLDLVYITKHILGVQLLDSPYKIIAADANKSNSVTTFDLVEIRKLILFINTDFPNNTSWRFVDKGYVFPSPSNPFQAQFPEVINLNNLTADALNNDFVAVKIGDVNGSAAVNAVAAGDDRTMVGDLVFNADDVNVQAGEIYTVEFKATDFNVSGYQFTLNFDKSALEFVEVVPGLADASNFGLTMVNEGVITTSWNSDEAKQLAADEVVFALTFKALSSGRMSDLINVNSRYTAAEAYNASAELMNVAMSFNHTLVAGGFELYQNTPNPFASNTNIGFYLPEATSATLTISDVQGKVVKVIEVDAVKGYNQVSLKRGDLGATGVLYYRLDTNTDSATRKMILVD